MPLAVEAQSPNHWTTREFARVAFFKGQVREGSCRVCDQLVHSTLVDGEVNRVLSQGLTLSINTQTPIGLGLCSHGHQVVNFFHVVGF